MSPAWFWSNLISALFVFQGCVTCRCLCPASIVDLEELMTEMYMCPHYAPFFSYSSSSETKTLWCLKIVCHYAIYYLGNLIYKSAHSTYIQKDNVNFLICSSFYSFKLRFCLSFFTADRSSVIQQRADVNLMLAGPNIPLWSCHYTVSLLHFSFCNLSAE